MRTALLVHVSASGQGSTEARGHRARGVVSSAWHFRVGRSVADEDDVDDDDFEDEDEEEDDEEDDEEDEETETWQVGVGWR